MKTAKSLDSNIASTARRSCLTTSVCIGFAAMSFAAAQSAVAACAGEYCEDVRILTLLTTADNLYVKVDGDMSQLNCSRYGFVYVTLSPTFGGGLLFKEQYATLLAHQLADRPVSFNIVPGSSGCTIKWIYTNSP